jgi:hypothetical protein
MTSADHCNGSYAGQSVLGKLALAKAINGIKIPISSGPRLERLIKSVVMVVVFARDKVAL